MFLKLLTLDFIEDYIESSNEFLIYLDADVVCIKID